MSKSNGNALYPGEDFIGKGFHKLDSKIISKRPPKIRWSSEFLAAPLEKQNQYLMKLANTMNHAAALIQDERDQLTVLCAKKEALLMAQQAGVRQNSLMLQSEVTRMNTQRQGFHKEVARLNERIRELENVHIH